MSTPYRFFLPSTYSKAPQAMSQQLGRQRKPERAGCILSRIRVRYLGAQPFTDPGTNLKNQIQVAEFMPEIA
jgi:hypothetical protein